MRGKWVLISILAVGAGIGVGALSLRRRQPPAPIRAPGAAVLAKQAQLTFSGNIRPQHVTSFGSTVPGNIEAFLVDVGADVYQGQVLARIGSAGLETARESASNAVDRAQDLVSKAENAVSAARLESSRAEADAQRARMQLERVQAVYDRQKMLHNAGATPLLTFRKAEQEFEAAQKEFTIMDTAARAGRDNVQTALNQLAAAKTALSDKTQELNNAENAYQAAEVRSPIDGVLVARNGEVGKPAGEAGDRLFQIATDLYALEVPVEPEPPVLNRIHPGQEAVVSILDLQTGSMPAVVKEIKGTQVIVQFENTLPAVRPGMRAEVRLKPE